MNRKILLGLLTLLVAAGLVFAASAIGSAVTDRPAGCPMNQPGPGASMGCQMQGCTAVLDKALGLTPDQREKMAAICDECCAGKSGVAAEMKAGQRELMALLTAANADRAKITAKIDEMSGLHAKMMLEGADRFMEMKALLTPAQKKTLAEKADELGPMGMCMGMGHCGMMGSCGMMGGPKADAGPKPMMGPGCGMAGTAACPMTTRQGN